MRLSVSLILNFILLMLMTSNLYGKVVNKPNMAIGYSVNIQTITKEKMQYAKSLGIDYIELSNIGSILEKDLSIKISLSFWINKIDSIKRVLDEVGMKVWSVHMPFSKQLDLSVLDESSREAVVAIHLQLLDILRPLKPAIILFHPSYYLGVNERKARILQLVKSVSMLDELIVNKYHMQMVVENMLGPELTIGNKERPLLRTFEECVDVFNMFPQTVGIAVDMCHIRNSELLLLQFGSRVKTLHVSDGDGNSEAHYLPCNGLGGNNWNLILETLNQINYQGVFMYECKYTDEKELKECYDFLVNNYNNYKSHNKRI